LRRHHAGLAPPPQAVARRHGAAAGIKTLMLSHLVPSGDPTVTDTMLLAAAQPHFAGRIVVGQDLLKI